MIDLMKPEILLYKFVFANLFIKGREVIVVVVFLYFRP